ncbi:prepilin-type N-terminal cleavage/methylation domain-containing protein [Vibrio ponticus]|uniref:Prepilin-type N-terminal cleavage/methylation domain-containing protein n=1 Tax=Vibrio ponticus TaxID=265668 RepID=A0A3N3E2T8_9VIBR|nr:prepilin-type N-terminal cleavage/methylation domain-containing protein [Vibrio ponticus]ROV61016.1 prepilin-type N-terminal cleavage/methylation domain-containing protein [Vibrio ponticus]
MKNNKNSGFTLIELVVVIVILALLAAVALPRFMSYSREAHEARADAAFSSFINAVQMYHSKWLTEGEPTGVVDYATGNIYPSVAGYPLTLRAGNSPDHLEGDDCVDLWRSLLNTDLTIERHSDPIYGHEADIIGWYQGTDVCYYYYTKGYSKGEDLPRLNYNVRSGEFSRKMSSPAE